MSKKKEAPPAPEPGVPIIRSAVVVLIKDIKQHPRNYRGHPEDQQEHLVKSMKDNGVYRNVVTAKDGTILAGHGVVLAATKAGLDRVPCVRLDIEPDSVEALKILTGDNEVMHLGEVDDRALTELLKQIKDVDVGELVGTGYDAAMLANLAYVTRPEAEVKDTNAAAAWVGMPEFVPENEPPKATILFLSEADKAEFGKLIGIPLDGKTNGRASAVWWPPKKHDDLGSFRVEG